MRIITYYTKRRHLNQAIRMRNSIRDWGYDISIYTDKWTRNQPEYQEHKDIFDTKRGAGYWAWKPLIILDALKLDDEILYLDSSMIPVDPHGIRRIMDGTQAVTTADDSIWIQKQWCKRDTFVLMGCDTEAYWNTPCIMAGILFVKQAGKWFIEEWRDYCLNYQIISDQPSSGNFPEFQDHRHDQAILCNLATKYDIPRVKLQGEIIDRP